MAAPTPPPAHTSAQPAARKRRLLSWVGTKGCSHALKLRHSFKLDNRTRMEVGLDLDIVDDQKLSQMLHSAAPWAAALYKLDPEDDDKGSLEVTPDWLAYNRRYCFGKKGAWWEVPLDAKLGLTYKGKPHLELGIRNLPLALSLAAALLYCGMPVSVKRKEVGGLAVHFPITAGGSRRDYSLQERVELDASLRRSEGGGLQLDLHQINGVLRLRQDE